jgi:hypothetical protein
MASRQAKAMGAWLAALVALAPMATGAAPTTKPVQFAKGATSTAIEGTIAGDDDIDYTIRAAAGQTLTVSLRKSNAQNFFNVLPPQSRTAAFVGGGADDFKVVLPDDGDYVIRLYLNRAAARRQESSRYVLTIGVEGPALQAVAASKDALVPGTRFHAKANIACTPMFETKPQQCVAGVIRRQGDGVATVVVLPASGDPRRILFVKGAPVSSDSPDPMTSSVKGDMTEVVFGRDERYTIPEALVRGG